MPALLVAIWGFLSSRWVLLVTFLSKLWLVLSAWRAFMWTLRVAFVVAVYLWLPLPEWLTSLPALLGSLPSEVVWAMDVIEFRWGLGVIMGAWATRIVIRLAFRVLGG